MPLASGTLLNNRYRIVSILGQGGMGAVYRASDEHLLIPVAVKENLFLTEEYGRQFRSEATILAGLRHPNLPHVSDYFSMENQGQYLVMDYIEGEDLRQRMERMGALPEREAILIGISICDALTYLHTRRAPIVHRDIKPGNIKVTPDGQAVLVDFGLAKIMQGSQVTSTGARAMTPGYSPPEQYGTARTDHRSDIYSLGATLYAALTGVIPEDGLARMTGKSELTPIRELTPKINRKLAETVEQALEVDPDDRFQTAEDFKRLLIESGELSNFYQERPSIAPPPVPGGSGDSSGVLNETPLENGASRTNGRSVRRRKKNRLLTHTLVPAIVLLAVGAFLLFAFNPNINKAVLGYFTASPGSPSESTEIASAATSQSPATGEPGSGSPSEESPQSTPTPVTEPTIAVIPTITLTPEPTATPRGGGMGQLAFASDRAGGIMQIYLMDATTRKPQPITGRKDGACQPTWAPDGLRIAFTSPCAKKQDSYTGSNIYTINVDAAGKADRNSIVQVTRSLEGAYDPAWSPDGDRIAYTSLQNGRSTIWMKNLKDGTEKELSLPRSVDKQPAWDPSGFQLAFVRQYLTNQIVTMPDTGESQNEFTVRSPVNNLWPAWSADGQVIYFSQFTADADTGPVLFYKRLEDRNKPVEIRVPISGNGPVAQVNPSPDGFWLAFESWDQQVNHDIYIMNVNGANQERLTTDPGYDFGPAWRPLQASAPAQP